MTENHTFTIDDELVTADGIVDTADIEEDGEQVHDQLPSVEEVKTNVPTKSSISIMTFKKKSLVLIVTGVILMIIFVVAARVTRNHKKKLRVDRDSSSDRIEAVVQFLRKNNISNEPSLRDQNSPQRQAARFMAVGDVYGMELTDETAEQFLERYVLVLLYYAMYGTEWTYNLRFMSAQDHCEWNSQFVTTSGRKLNQGVYCDENGFVTKLALGTNVFT
jgi:hypothetical protein